MSSLFENVKDKVIAAKQHLKKGAHSYLEIIFVNQDLLKEYASNGVVKPTMATSLQMLINPSYWSKSEMCHL
ncbi:5623_t:CDS:1, partial [Dentiscutata erythropus]